MDAGAFFGIIGFLVTSTIARVAPLNVAGVESMLLTLSFLGIRGIWGR